MKGTCFWLCDYLQDYNLVVTSNEIMGELENETVALTKYIRDTYAPRFPELEALIQNPLVSTWYMMPVDAAWSRRFARSLAHILGHDGVFIVHMISFPCVKCWLCFGCSFFPCCLPPKLVFSKLFHSRWACSSQIPTESLNSCPFSTGLHSWSAWCWMTTLSLLWTCWQWFGITTLSLLWTCQRSFLLRQWPFELWRIVILLHLLFAIILCVYQICFLQDYVRTVHRIGNENDITAVDLSRILPSATVMVVTVTATTTSGKPLPAELLGKVRTPHKHPCDILTLNATVPWKNYIFGAPRKGDACLSSTRKWWGIDDQLWKGHNTWYNVIESKNTQQ